MYQATTGRPALHRMQRRSGMTEDFCCPEGMLGGPDPFSDTSSSAGDDGAPPIKPTAKQVGRLGEQIARAFLETHGYTVLAMNWRCHSGEADIVAYDNLDDVTTLVEVKSRLSEIGPTTSFPEKAVDRRKQGRYQRIALTWLAFHPQTTNVRFDVIALNIYAPLCAKVRLVPGAFEWDE